MKGAAEGVTSSEGSLLRAALAAAAAPRRSRARGRTVDTSGLRLEGFQPSFGAAAGRRVSVGSNRDQGKPLSVTNPFDILARSLQFGLPMTPNVTPVAAATFNIDNFSLDCNVTTYVTGGYESVRTSALKFVGQRPRGATRLSGFR